MIGEKGRVLQVTCGGDIILAIKGRTWAFNPLCLSPADEGSGTDTPTRGESACLACQPATLNKLLLGLVRHLHVPYSPE